MKYQDLIRCHIPLEFYNETRKFKKDYLDFLKQHNLNSEKNIKHVNDLMCSIYDKRLLLNQPGYVKPWYMIFEEGTRSCGYYGWGTGNRGIPWLAGYNIRIENDDWFELNIFITKELTFKRIIKNYFRK